MSCMESEPVTEAKVAIEEQAAQVMASIEEDETFILADVTRDDAYLTMSLDGAASLPAWR